MARNPSPREHYDLEVSKITGMIRAVENDVLRGDTWKKEVLESLRRARELFAESPPKRNERARPARA